MANHVIDEAELAKKAGEALEYIPETGALIWRHRSDMPRNWNARYAGKEAGSVNGQGYIHVSLGKVGYKAHRLAWLITYGAPLPSHIDHINGDTQDNRICNLRAATHRQNAYNMRKLINSSGFKGVSWEPNSRKWRATIKCDGVRYCLGLYSTAEDASVARTAAARYMHKDFARLE